MEKLKKLKEICEPDSRRTSSVTCDENGNFWYLTLDRMHSNVESIQLHDGVPEKVRDQFQTVRNLYLYSWFYYPFDVAAQFLALVTVEAALKDRFADKSPIKFTDEGLKEYEESMEKERSQTFTKLLRKAVQEKLITDKGFSFILAAEFEGIARNLIRNLKLSKKHPYCDLLLIILPHFRNKSAHGISRLNAKGGEYLMICAELINQLFVKCP